MYLARHIHVSGAPNFISASARQRSVEGFYGHPFGGIEDLSDLMLAIHPLLFEHGRLAGVKEKKVDLAVRTKSYRVCVGGSCKSS